MTRDFDHVRGAAAQSTAGRALRRTVAAVGAAWATAISAHWVRTFARRFRAAPPTGQLRWAAAVTAIATAVHLVFRALMPATVAPAMPAAFMLAITALAAITAWQAESVHRAWRRSRLARLFDRST